MTIWTETLPFSLIQPRTALLLLAFIAADILLVVFALQYVADLAPCRMCIWQRWPFAILIAVGLTGAFWKPRLVLVLTIPLLLVSAGLAGYHVGVEQGWIALPAGCTAGGAATSVEELKALLAAAPPSCDQVGFTMLGLSLAGWNLVVSLLLAGFSLFVMTRPQGNQRQGAGIA
ncbi:MAG: disulfide bond formation protein B [Geminicoccales bacterium]